MSKSVFISYVYEDKEYLQKLKEWGQKRLLGNDIVITHERKDCRSQGDTAIREEIKSMIQGAGTVLFLIGQNSHNHPWIKYEADCALSKNRKIVLIRIPETTGGKPKILSKYSEITFDVNKIKVNI